MGDHVSFRELFARFYSDCTELLVDIESAKQRFGIRSTPVILDTAEPETAFLAETRKDRKHLAWCCRLCQPRGLHPSAPVTPRAWLGGQYSATGPQFSSSVQQAS